MGLTFNLGRVSPSVFTDSSLNVGIGGAPSGTYKLEVTGTAKVSSTLLVSGASTFSGNVTLNAYGNQLKIGSNGGTDGFIGIGSTQSTMFIGDYAVGNKGLTLNLSTGAATFSSTITAVRGTMNGTDGDYAFFINGGATAGSSYGLRINAGGNSSDYAIRTKNAAQSSDLFVVRGDGNVGIGTTTPDNLLVVSGGTGSMKLEATTTNRSAIQIFNTANTLYIGVDNASASYFGYAANSANIQTLNYPIIFSNGSGAPLERMRITSGGYTKATNSGSYYSSAGGLFHEFVQSASNQDSMWIYNTATSGYGMTMNMPNTAGNGSNYFLRALNSTSSYFLYSNGSSTFSSDRNLKKNIETTRDGYLEDLMNLRVVKYNWNTQEDGEAKELGLIAQEVAEVFPSLVVDQSIPRTREIKQEDGSIVEEQYEVTQKGLKVSVLPFILLKAIQEQQATITSLQDRLDKAGL